jgi:hypothetical protein
MVTETGEAVNGFRLNPPGPFQLRNYDSENLDELKRVYRLVDTLMERHRALIPGSMNRLMRQWCDDLSKAIKVKSGEAGSQ